MRLPQSPLTFLYIGLGWLVLSSLVGLAMLIGIVRGTPLPSALRLIHVHGALIGGVLQIMLAGVCLSEWNARPKGTRGPSFVLLFSLLNAAVIGLCMGFWIRDRRLLGAAGLLLLIQVVVAIPSAWRVIRQAGTSWFHRLYFGLSLGALTVGIGVGLAVALQWLQPWYGVARLGHIHLTVLLFAVLTLLGFLRVMLPVMWGTGPRRDRLDLMILALLLVGTCGVLTGFLFSSVYVQLMAGGVLLIGLVLNAYDLFRSWLEAGQPGTVWSDHLLMAVCFLLLTGVLGIGLGINALSYPPPLPYGTLHLVAYTHTAFIGFLLQALFGALSYLLPVWLTQQRVPSNKKRPAYLATLTGIMNRWRAWQTFSLNLGTLSLTLVASLTWSVPLGAPVIHAATWFGVATLATSLALFSAKVAHMSGQVPGTDRSP